MNALIGHHVIVDCCDDTCPDGTPCLVQVRVTGYDDGQFLCVDASGKITPVAGRDLRVKGDNLHQLFCEATCDTLPCNRPAPPEEVPVVDADPVV